MSPYVESERVKASYTVASSKKLFCFLWKILKNKEILMTDFKRVRMNVI